MGQSILLSALAVCLCAGAGADRARAANPAAKSYRVDIEAHTDPFVFSPQALGAETKNAAGGGSGPGDRGWSGQVEFYIDNALVAVSRFDRPFGNYRLQLGAGLHQFHFGVTMRPYASKPPDVNNRPRNGDEEQGEPVVEDDCVGQFEVDGPVVLQPRLEFILQRPAPDKIADVLACSLERLAP
jgi:hypothetical protein